MNKPSNTAAVRPDRWTAHHPTKCAMDELPEEGYVWCRCPPGWPRTAAYWKGETALGRRQVEVLIKKWRAHAEV